MIALFILYHLMASLFLTPFPRRDIVWFGTVGTPTRQRTACLVEGSASLPKWHDAVRLSGGGGHGRGLLVRDRTRAAAGWMCSAELILQRGADQPAQPSDIDT